ncbi:hypothetical protein HELRODRAFT_105502 [Helobdella robusta]|uniref:RING-type domain-containing protein n=1 Tax=Helobdella robusta TaxID=6412 RepID=T1EDV9_HELRO|nr:hypothetical protein HELRODRAFT_105502 [Helobdella robusta]ESO12746.1 hypothetical protein HELRODRAFT_105502 [Helobdella robusta]
MGNGLSSIVNRDSVSCLAVHSKFLAVGTHWGSIYIMDHVGNVIEQKHKLIMHSTTVNQMSIDASGDYIVSCSDDGKVILNGLYTSENNQVVNLNRPIKSVAIDPNFSKNKSNKHFIAGDNKLILYEKSFLNRMKTYILHQGESSIQNIKWRSSLVAWSFQQGVNVYDMSVRKRISKIPRHIQPGFVPCILNWKDDVTLIIGWNNVIQVCLVKEPVTTKDDKEPPTRYMEIIAVKMMDFVIAGICPHNKNFIVLSYAEQDSHQDAATDEYAPCRPHIRVIDSQTGEEVSNDALSIKGFQSYKCVDYHLECNVDECMLFIVSPKDVVVARQRDEDDHIDWLIEHEAFQEALEFALKNVKMLKRITTQDVGFHWFNSLLEDEKYKEAAELCSRILGRNKELWETNVIRFKQFNQLAALAPFIPTESPTLDRDIYDMVLYEFIQNKNDTMLLDLIKRWPSDVYTVEMIVHMVMDELEVDRNNTMLLESLGYLYTLDGKYEKALYIFIKLGHKDIFDLIFKHNLYNEVSCHVITIMNFDPDTTVNMLINNLDKIPMKTVVSQLKSQPKFLHSYLSQLFLKDQHIGKEYHQMQVELYAEFDRSKLMHFLKSSSYITLSESLEICRAKDLVPEMVFLLDRMGNTKEALQLTLKRGQSVKEAIDFCMQHLDKELWQDLINYAIDKPEYISVLLNNVGGHIDPVSLISRIKNRMEIPGLRDSLVTILHDCSLQISLQKTCGNLLNTDCIEMFKLWHTLQSLATRIDGYIVCSNCSKKLLQNSEDRNDELVIFQCRHAFHTHCVLYDDLVACPICCLQKSHRSSFMFS